ncbi:MAG: fasciclin domain-containing protein [Pseudomonadota bacterium]
MDRRKFLATGTLGLAAAATITVPATPLRAQAGTIVDVAVATPQLSTLVAAVTAAGLVDTLSSPGPFTVFAPTDDAFAALPAGTVEGLLNDIPALTNILTYHVSGALYPASALLGQRGRVPTVQGEFLHIDATGGGVVINGSTNVITPDVNASNGVVHLIDSVLLP